MKIIGRHFEINRCWSGRLWFNFFSGWLAIGFGPYCFIERIYWKRQLYVFSYKGRPTKRHKVTHNSNIG